MIDTSAPNCGLRLFGYNVGEVNEELNKIDHEYLKLLKDLEIKISNCSSENLRLKEEILTLKSKKSDCVYSSEFLESAIESATYFIELYNKHISQEIGKLNEKEQNASQLYKGKLFAIGEEIKNTKQILESALEEILRISSTMNPATGNQASDTVPENAAQTVVAPCVAPVIPDTILTDIVSEPEPPADIEEEAPASINDEIKFHNDLIRKIDAFLEKKQNSFESAAKPDPAYSEEPSPDIQEASWETIPKIEYINFIGTDEPESADEN